MDVRGHTGPAPSRPTVDQSLPRRERRGAGFAPTRVYQVRLAPARSFGLAALGRAAATGAGPAPVLDRRRETHGPHPRAHESRSTP